MQVQTSRRTISAERCLPICLRSVCALSRPRERHEIKNESVAYGLVVQEMSCDLASNAPSRIRESNEM